MPTRIVAGLGSLATIGTLARELRMTKVLVVSDPVISRQTFHKSALDALAEAGIKVSRIR
jgi:alcohol dehydrogenase class IV